MNRNEYRARFITSRAMMFRPGAWLGAVIFSLWAVAADAQPDMSVIDLIDPPQPVATTGNAIEVIDFFSYGCPHCANLDPLLAKWLQGQPADVVFKQVPATHKIKGIDSVAIYHTLEAMGQLARLHGKLFAAANVDNLPLGVPKVLAEWLESQGVKPGEYDEVQKTPAVQTKIQRSREMTDLYKVRGIPAMVIQGRYLAPQRASPDKYLANIDALIQAVRTRAPIEKPAVK